MWTNPRLNRGVLPAGIALLLLFCLPALAAIRLPSLVASGMVLQQQTIVNIWGWADPGERVTLQADWLVEQPQAVTGSDGRWLIRVPTGPAGGPHAITLTAGNTLVLSDILFGEVWLCSGQSNMEFTIAMLGGWKFYRQARRDLKHSDYSAVRLCLIEKRTSSVPLDSCNASWERADKASVEHFSAAAWFFGKALHDWLSVPVGIILSAWGGTPAEAWTDIPSLQANPDLDYFLRASAERRWEPSKPAMLYNAMIHPVTPYVIRGVAWYQGESNILDADLYASLFATTIRSWRRAWGVDDLPFYFVQIAPFTYSEPFPAAAFLREAQLKCSLIPNTGMVVTLDIGDRNDIHPKQKQAVGERLALLAMSGCYGRKEIFASGPLFDTLSLEGDRLRLHFRETAGGLFFRGGDDQGFRIAGSDGIFRKATATVESDDLLVWSDSVPKPLDVRYAFENDSYGTLFNLAALPASSFRTDDHPLLVRPVKMALRDSGHLNKYLFLTCADTACAIHYRVDGVTPAISDPLYRGPIPLHGSVSVVARAFKGDVGSAASSRLEYHMHAGVGKTLRLKYPFSPNYSGGGNALLDGIFGTTDFRDGRSQGFPGNDIDAVIDLGSVQHITGVALSSLQSTPSWIFLPLRVELEVSFDGEHFMPAGKVEITDTARLTDSFIRRYRFTTDLSARYLHLRAVNRGVCPKWHEGKGQRAWLFSDEIIIETGTPTDPDHQ